MKHLFLLIAILLAAASFFVWRDMPEAGSDREVVVYWTTDRNPARAEQIQAFDTWQVDVGLVDDEGQPLIDLRLDVGNNENEKKIIQSVSGVAGDTMDLFGGQATRFFEAMGVLEDVTDTARTLGYSFDKTYPAIVNEISILDGDQRRQLTYPCNVALQLLVVNNALFEELGLEPPSGRMPVDEFESLGSEFVRRANEKNQREGVPFRTYFVDMLDFAELARSMGVDRFNETLTDTNIDAPESVEALRLIRKWTYDDRFLPSASDRDAMASGGGYGGATIEMFERGFTGMFKGGRWHLIRLRQTNQSRVAAGREPLDLGTTWLPDGGHPSTRIGTRAASIYVDGAKTPRDLTLTGPLEGVTIPAGTPWAVFFQAFLASDDYNAQIIADGDGLPGNPVFADGDAYYRPAENPELGIYASTEWDFHGPHLEAAQTIADPGSYSPYVLLSDAEREENLLRDRYLADPPFADARTPQMAMAEAARRVRRQIALNLEDRPELREHYAAAVADQEEIDRLKAAGELIPASLVRNPFYLRFYREQGMLLEDGPGGTPALPAPPAEVEPREEAANGPVEEMLEDTDSADFDDVTRDQPEGTAAPTTRP